MSISRRPCRAHATPRCRVCGLHLPLCVCAQLPRLQLPERFLLVQHAVELDRPTNTGRMVEYMLPNSRLVLHGVRGQTTDETPLCDPELRYFLLYPRPGAPVLSPEMLAGVPRERTAVVLLDGSWRQAARMSHRLASLRGLPCVQLPPGAASAWDIRRPLHPGQLCTLEAAIRIVGILGHAAAAERMMEAMALINARMLYMKAILKSVKTLEDIRAERL